MTRFDIINTLISKYKFTRYLEIGTQHGNCFREIKAPYKLCVDPIKAYEYLTHEMTSDLFFEQNNDFYDIIFIDGLHTEEQTTIDINNALNCLSEGGVIVVHDSLPHCEEYTNICWSGTVFRSIIEARYDSKLNVEVIDTDCGCALIKKAKSFYNNYDKVCIDIAKTYKFYETNKIELMNVLSIDDFIKKYQ